MIYSQTNSHRAWSVTSSVRELRSGRRKTHRDLGERRAKVKFGHASQYAPGVVSSQHLLHSFFLFPKDFVFFTGGSSPFFMFL